MTKSMADNIEKIKTHMKELEEQVRRVPDPVLKAVTGIVEAAKQGDVKAIFLMDQVFVL